MIDTGKHSASFRDPDGFLFVREGRLYRQVNRRCKEDYDLLISSGLYGNLTAAGLLVEHEEVELSLSASDEAYRVLKPRIVPFISYPHEWCFSQLRDAALTTLEIQKMSVAAGMSLKDCSAYNIQFDRGRPLFIDTLSFEKYREGEPWTAYRQFCQHFLAPLALMSCTDVRLSQLFRIYIDGIPLDLASSLLPFRTRFSFGLYSHIHLHSRYQERYGGITEKPAKKARVSRNSLLGIVDSLESAVKRLKYRPAGTEWAEYYDDTNYTGKGIDQKEKLVASFLETIDRGTVWDLGANTGLFSRAAAAAGHDVISFDIDPAAVERNYLDCRKNERDNILPLVLDLTNPSPGMGWAGEERMSLEERGPAGTAMALALIHHLAISNNLPFDRIAGFLCRLCEYLLIEFVPKDDSQVSRLLVSREDIFEGYTQDRFEEAFRQFFTIERTEKIVDSKRTLYLMRRIGEKI